MEKINIYVPEKIGSMLKRDASMFEVYKRDGQTINKNRFLVMLIKGYYEDYVTEKRSSYDKVLLSLDDTEKLSAKEKEHIAKRILRNVIYPEVPSRKGKNPARLSLKPTKDTETLIEQIMIDLDEDDYISQYFCRMFISYCEKPFSKREQIIFRENFEKLQFACDTRKSITFKTIWNTGIIHEVIPYKVVIGPEEMFNYLLCAELNPNTGKQEAKTYRLNRIDRLNYGRSVKSIDDTVKNYLDEMLKYGPQYMINEEMESCVRLNIKGVKSFNSIYFGRPQYERVQTDGNQTYYYFKCSIDQLFLYFKRFEGNEAEVIYPKSLRDRVVQFHKQSLKTYKEG